MVLRTQASLGTGLKKIDIDDAKASSMVLAKIKKVNYVFQSVEVQLIGSVVGSATGDKGEFSVPFPKDFIGKTPEGALFGHIPLIVPGSLALIGFLNSNYNNPIILSIYGAPKDNKKITSNPLQSGEFGNNEVFKYGSAIHTIYPSLNYSFRDGEGTTVHTFNGKTFLSVTSNKDEKMMASDFNRGTQYEQFYMSRYSTNTLIEPRMQNAPDILFKHQGEFLSSGGADNHVTMFNIQEDGTLRFSLLNTATNNRTTQEMKKDGGYRVRVQGGSTVLDSGGSWIEFGIDKSTMRFYIKTPDKKFEFGGAGKGGGGGGGGGGFGGGLYIDDAPMLEGLEDGLKEAGDAVARIKSEIDKIDKLLEGAGKANIEELIRVSEEMIAESIRTREEFIQVRTNMGNIVDKINGMVMKYDGFMKTMGDFVTTSSALIMKVNDDNAKMQLQVTTLQNSYNEIKTIINNEVEKSVQSTLSTAIKSALDSTLPSAVRAEVSKSIDDAMNTTIPQRIDSAVEAKVSDTVNAKVDTAISAVFTTAQVADKVKANFLAGKSALLLNQDDAKTEAKKPTVIISTDAIKNSMGASFTTTLTKVQGELKALETEEERISYIDTNLRTLAVTDLKKLVGTQEMRLIVQYKDAQGTINSLATTNYQLLYNNLIIPIDTKSSGNDVLSRIKVCYELNNNPIAEMCYTSPTW